MYDQDGLHLLIFAARETLLELSYEQTRIYVRLSINTAFEAARFDASSITFKTSLYSVGTLFLYRTMSTTEMT